MDLQTLHGLLTYELEDLYSAESQMAQALPKMAQAAHSQELRKAFDDHLTETRNQMSRLQKAFNNLGHVVNGHHCKGMEGLIKEGEDLMRATGDPAVIDAALIGAAQAIEHYEIAAYGTARAHAEQLGFSEVVDLLQENLDQEGKTNKMLTKLAEGALLKTGINEKAAR